MQDGRRALAIRRRRRRYELGKALFFYRAGAWDLSCASCHGEEDKRIRMQDLPVLYKPQAARPIMATWPAYRVSNSQFKTMQWRLNDCYRQMRFPEPKFASEATIALNTFLTRDREGRAVPRAGNQAMKRVCFCPGPRPALALAVRAPRDVQKVLHARLPGRGQATMDRVVQDGLQRICTETMTAAARPREAARSRPDEDHRLSRRAA